MITEKEIKKLKESIYAIIESEMGREIVDDILTEKYGRKYLNIKQNLYRKLQK